MVRAAPPARARRHLSASSATTPTAPVHAAINTTISTTCSSSAAAPRTAGAAFTASAAPTSTSTAVPRPLPPLPWVWAPSGIPMTVLLVSGGGPLPVADLEREPVDGAGAAALDPAPSLAPRADLHAPPA